jgi:hypothetical protein
MNFLIFIIILVLLFGAIILFSVLGFIRSVFSAIFGLGRRRNSYQTSPDQPSYEADPKSKTKVFAPSEGEYVDFEEVKD